MTRFQQALVSWFVFLFVVCPLVVCGFMIVAQVFWFIGTNV